MADFVYNDLFNSYEEFREPLIEIEVEGEVLKKEDGLAVTRAEIDLTSGYEAGLAEVTLVGAYKGETGAFDISKVKKYLLLGSMIRISLGYGAVLREVFRGFIARVNFIVPGGKGGDVPSIQLTAMDIKGNMMANRHSKRLSSKCYSDAVKEVIQGNPFFGYKDGQQKDFTELVIDDTPDKPSGDSTSQQGSGQSETDDKRVEMVEESDYEFVVKAAKKYNYEFFAVGKTLYFIQARKNKDILIELSLAEGIKSLNVGYDITGLVGQVEVRNVDPDKGGFIGKSQNINNKISMGNKAKPLVSDQSLVYIDPTADDQDKAGYRAGYLADKAGYSLGSLHAQTVGIPELIPGRFMTIKDSGKPVENDFYLTRVKHVFTRAGYYTELDGCANSMKS